MGNKLDPSFVAALVSVDKKGIVRISQAKSFDARVDARIHASRKNKSRPASAQGRWRVIPTTPGPIVRV